MRILVTAGATREPLDAVRFLSNISTGATGIALAHALQKKGHEMIVIGGTGSACHAEAPRRRVSSSLERFTTASDLLAKLTHHLSTGDYDAVIMAAAVSDYRPDTTAAGKISSAPEKLQLNLLRNPKILPQLKSLSPRPLKVIGFKLTVGATPAARLAAVAAQFASGPIDAVVHNDLTEISSPASGGRPFRLFLSPAKDVPVLSGPAALADALEGILK